MSETISNYTKKLIENGIDFVVAKVAETKGSAPRKRGAVLVMTPQGERYGTVGGGLLEARTEELCRQVLRDRTKAGTFEFVLDEQQSGDNVLEMGCGGDALIQIDYIDAAAPGDFFEEYELKSDAYIFGGGHVGYAIEPLLRYVGFKTIVIDDREEYANPQRYPSASATVACDDFTHCFDEIETDEDSYIIIVTRGHYGDLDVLREAIKRPNAYIGMIGSKRKNELLFETLRAEGVTDEELSRVYAPIGVDIKAETPEEIGISVVGEIIRVRSEKLEKEMRFREVPDIHAN